jgi:hypothetical protein
MTNSTDLTLTPAATRALVGWTKLTADWWVLPHVRSYAQKMHVTGFCCCLCVVIHLYATLQNARGLVRKSIEGTATKQSKKQTLPSQQRISYYRTWYLWVTLSWSVVCSECDKNNYNKTPLVPSYHKFRCIQ